MISEKIRGQHEYLFDGQHQEKETPEVISLSGTEFENLCCRLLLKMDFFIVKTSMSVDGSIEYIATYKKPMFKGKYIVQCKCNKDTVGVAVVRELCRIVSDEKAIKGILLTTGSFSYSAINFAENNNLELIDGDALHALLNEYGLTSKI